MGFKVQSRDGDSQHVQSSQLLKNAKGILPADPQGRCRNKMHLVIDAVQTYLSLPFHLNNL